jgi:hypothetical protein
VSIKNKQMITVPESTGIKRAKGSNPYNYTEAQLAEREVCLKQLATLYPSVSRGNAEMAYDICMNTPEDKLHQIMDRVDTVPPRHIP